MSSTSKTFFKELPFPVHPTQRLQLQQYKASAVAKEKVLVARKKERLLQLQKYVAERIEGKRAKPNQVPVKVPSSEQVVRSEHVRNGQRVVADAPFQLQPPVSSRTTRSTVVPNNSAVAKVGPMAGGKGSRGTSGHPTHRRHSPDSLLGAIARGHLTRRLFYSPKVQAVAQTIKDLLDVLETLQEPLSAPDQQLKQSTMAQVELEASLQGLLLDLFLDGVEADIAVEFGGELLVGRHNFHDIFFKLPPSKQMLYLSATGPPDPTRPSGPTHDRTAGLKGVLRSPPSSQHSSAHSRQGAVPSSKDTSTTGHHNGRGGGGGGGGGKLSAATIKCMQRRRKSARKT